MDKSYEGIKLLLIIMAKKRTKKIKPKEIFILRWAGGKRWLSRFLHVITPKNYNRYHEPFLGSGSVFFNLQPKKSFLEKMIKEANGPVIAVSDYVKLVSEQIAPYIKCPFVALGTDGFGRSDTRENLRNFFEVNRYYIILYALDKLAVDGKISKNKVDNCIKKYKIDFNKPNPNKV